MPASTAVATIPKSLQIAVGSPVLEGADHRPGITLLEWPQQDLREAILRYVERRGTFGSVLNEKADLTLRIATKLALASRLGRYHYLVRLRAEIKDADQTIRTYLSEQTAIGSSARWVTASDRDPIESALQLALDDVFAQIESDRAFYVGRTEGSLR